MTVKERAETVMSIFRCMLIETTDGRMLTGIDLMDRIAHALRDQIEDCAKVADKWFGDCADEIRALAGPTTTDERKGIKMLHKYKIEFRWESGIQIYPYTTEGVIIEAHTAEDALTQARIEIDEITRQNASIIGWHGSWIIIKIVALPDATEEKGD